MKKILSLILVLLFVISLCACGTNSDPSSSNQEYSKMMETYEHSQSLIVSFSYTGTTTNIAQFISNITKADTTKITPSQPYEDKDVETGNENSRSYKESQDISTRPPIENEILDFNQYTTIFIGYPIWHGKAPKVIFSFLDKFDCTNKLIIPFCTSAETGIEESVEELRATYPNLNIADGKRFTKTSTEKEIETWLKENNYI